VKGALWLALGLLNLLPTIGSAAGDPARGERLHRICEQCHGTALYAPQRRRVTDLKALRRVVERYGDYDDPRLSKQDVGDLVAWPNRDFYKFAA